MCVCVCARAHARAYVCVYVRVCVCDCTSFLVAPLLVSYVLDTQSYVLVNLIWNIYWFITEENNLKEIERHFSAKDWYATGAVDEFKTKLDKTTVNHYCAYYSQQSHEYSVSV